ncbi:uncharacterized protein LOC108415505 [Pygocentrus nattereri]|uniref:uncharacterized protein LOC108415505 n=1 Tax=Pygocentrus nattereri TaxID=42514 RepID=UPI00189119F9|nr:uncharacterized protein LOC108415505 [Pygocentrus nattereri]
MWTLSCSLKVVQVSMIRLSGNGTLKEGDSVNLTCAVNCTLSSPQFVWFQNTDRLPESGSVLHLPALTVRNSGNYSCALRNYETFTSEMISLDVEGPFPVLGIVWIVLGVILFMLLVAILAVVYKRRKKAKAPEEDIRGSDRETQVGERTQGKQTKLQDNHVNEAAEAELLEDEITYASVCTKPNKPKERFPDFASPPLHTAVGFTSQYKGSPGRRPRSPKEQDRRDHRFPDFASPPLHTAVGFTSQYKGSPGRRPRSPKEQDRRDHREVNAREEEENSRSGWKTQDEDVMYASVSIQPTIPKKGPVHTVQEDDSIIYSAVKTN